MDLKSVGSKRITILGVVIGALGKTTDFKIAVIIGLLGLAALVGVTLTDLQKQAKEKG